MNRDIEDRLLEVIDDVLGLKKRDDEFSIKDYVDLCKERLGMDLAVRTATEHLTKLERAGRLTSRVLLTREKVFCMVDGNIDDL